MDVDSMKVVDLKRELKALFLPVSGTKAELAERLKAALEGEADALPAGELSDEALLNEEDELLKNTKTEHVPPKEAPKVTKPVAKVETVQTVASLQKQGVLQSMEDNLFSDAPEPEPPSDRSGKMKARAARFGLPEAKLEERAKKFGVQKIGEAPVVDKQKLLDRAKRFNISVGDDGKPPPAPKAEPVAKTTAPITAKPEDLEKLRKRAERFGTVSATLSKVDAEEQLSKRKAEFEETVTLDAVADISSQNSKRKRIVF